MRIVTGLAALLLSASAFAVSPQFWRVDNPDDLLSGELDGFAITSRGVLTPGPEMKKLATVADPFVLSQAADPSGVIFVGTGNAGKVYRLDGDNLRLLYTAPEPEIYALAYSKGSLYVGSSPNGKIYKVDPQSGQATTFFEPKEAYVWAIAPLEDGSLAVGTGVDGKLFRVSATGEGKVWFDSDETHIRSVAAAGNGRVLLGGAGSGRIYEISGSGTARALYDSDFTEISSIYYDPKSGEAWAAGVSSVLPSAAPAHKETKENAAAAKTSGSANTQDQEKKDDTSASSSVDISFSFDDSNTANAQASGNSALYRIDRDGYVDTVRKFEHQILYAITRAGDGGIYFGTGPQGRIYELRNGEISLAANVPQKQVVSLNDTTSGLVATTTNSGAVYRLTSAPGTTAEMKSSVKDTSRFSRFGVYRIEGDNLDQSRVSIAFRSGNTAGPDSTWSAWSSAAGGSTGPITAPAARYLQWKLTAKNPVPSLRIDSVSSSYVNRNVAPTIDGVVVNEPAVIYLSGSYPAAPQVVEATSPDEFGIFTSLNEPLDRTAPGKKYFRKGYRTISWKATDANGDDLIYSLEFRPVGSSQWLRLRDRIDESQFNFDTSQLPDGDYEVRLKASDEPANPTGSLSDTKAGIELTVDNTPPVITGAVEGSSVKVKITDSRSPIGRAEYSVDAEKWIPLVPDDGISDSSTESYTIPLAEAKGKFVIVRALDSFFNVQSAQISTAR